MLGFFLSLSKRIPPRLGGPASAPHSAGGRCSGQAENMAPAARPALSSSRRLKRGTGRRVGYCVCMGNPPLNFSGPDWETYLFFGGPKCNENVSPLSGSPTLSILDQSFHAKVRSTRVRKACPAAAGTSSKLAPLSKAVLSP